MRDTGTDGFFNDLEFRIAELVERGFNCIRIEGVAWIAQDVEGQWVERSRVETYQAEK